MTLNLFVPRTHVIARALTNPFVQRGDTARTVRADLFRVFTHTTAVNGL